MRMRALKFLPRMKEKAGSEHYVPASLECASFTAAELNDPLNTGYLASIVEQIVAAEAPVSLGLLSVRLASLCGIARVTPKIRERVQYLCDLKKKKSYEEGERVFFWGSLSPDTYTGYRCHDDSCKRDPSDISCVEAANAILKALTVQYGMPKEDSLAEGAKLLGFKRMTEQVKALMISGFESGLGSDKFSVDDRGWAVTAEK